MDEAVLRGLLYLDSKLERELTRDAEGEYICGRSMAVEL
jgi:hypothetical protein